MLSCSQLSAGARILRGLCGAGLATFLHPAAPSACGAAALQLGLRQQHGRRDAHD